MRDPIRIANCSGFYGDRFSAAKEMLEGGAIDVLTGDYLAELTMLILWKARQARSDGGFAVTFLKQMEQVLGTAMQRGVKVVSNAGGLNPGGLAEKLREVSDRLDLGAKIVHIEGDDLLPRLPELLDAGHRLTNMDTGRPLAVADQPPVSANAYLGSWGIAEALTAGADVVICPRVTDAALTVGPAAWHHDWHHDDWNRLAGATVAGHLIECGCQVTGGNYSFFHEVEDLRHPGFPIAEVAEDGSTVITKHDGTGGLVSVGTVTAQLLYEISGGEYLTPDVTARFDSVRLHQQGRDRVLVSGAVGAPPPPDTKVCINYQGGYRNSITFLLTGLDIEGKAAVLERALLARLGGAEGFDEFDVTLSRSDHADPARNDCAVARLTVTVKDRDAAKVGRAFSGTAIELGLANYPGFCTAAPPGAEQAYGVYWPALIPSGLVEQVVVHPDGGRVPIPPVTGEAAAVAEPPGPASLPAPPGGPARRAPLGTVFGARSGDKGGNANCALWARSEEGFAWLRENLTVPLFRILLPEAEDLQIHRYELPNVLAVNFVIVGLLGEGVAASARPDPQAKGLGEFLRARYVDIPTALLDRDGEPADATDVAGA